MYETIIKFTCLLRMSKNSFSFAQPGGSLIFTTINRTPQSYLLAILGAEYVLNIVERGTHDWDKFVPDDELASLVIHSKYMSGNKLIVDSVLIKRYTSPTHMFLSVTDGFDICEIQGLCYNPFTRKWSKLADTTVNYALVAQKEIIKDKRN